MLDLDMHLGELNECYDLMRKYDKMDLTGDLSRNFIHELSAINDSFHEQLTEAFDENVEISALTDAFLVQSPQVRTIDLNHELNKSLVYVVEGFITDKLEEVGE